MSTYRVPTVSQYGTFSMGVLDTPDAPTGGMAIRINNETPVVGFVVRTSDGKEWIKHGTGDFDYTEVPATISGLSASGQAAFANLDKLRS